ncbi:MAG: Carboxyl-terminal protease [Microgenomates group bacterium GW2011_GWC1_43_13]|nr:MAG: Carboxyl-terminal protease [Microgenomates group bacterium GW2011_GWC1_43_13]
MFLGMIFCMRIKVGFSKARNFILILVFAVAVFAGGYRLGVQGYKAEVTKALQVNISRTLPPEKNVDFSLFWQIWDVLSEKYFDKSKLIPSQLVYGAISGMVSAVGDPYTMYLPPSQNKIVNDDLSGSFEGVGIEIGYKNTHLAVVSPLPGSPAEKAGVKPGDYIAHITDLKKQVDVDSSNLGLSQAVDYIRGPAGTVVTLTLVREGIPAPIVVDLTRVKLDIPSVILSWVGTGSTIANVKIAKFDSATPGEWDKVVREITDKCQTQKVACKGIIIDLRNNPGGYLQSAVEIASDFVPIDTTVVIQENGDGIRQEFKSDKLPRLKDYKVVVLVNGGSASASEILAGALRDNRGIKLVGDKSFGKGTIQEPVNISGGSGLHVTTAKWLTPNGTWVHEKGLIPDVEIANEDATVDAQLEAAVKLFE